ncbi:MAG TPA: glycerate kinase, partial [Candidatus Limnocylindrales bacterium]|nr:glycerate kinase [Candidatus Limnocylindrales bacterium]
MRIVIAPDSFKGSLSSVAVARALAAGWRRARPDDEVLLMPLADGGEGTLAAIEAAGGWIRRRTPAHDPVGRPIEAAWLQSADGDRAVVELAAASGISRLSRAEQDPFAASTFGTGELLTAAIGAGASEITLGIGGSATTDGGRGFVEALGGRVSGAARDEHDWSAVTADLRGLDRRLEVTRLHVACDVDNPLLGPRGAAATYGPQKGAAPDDVPVLDRRLGAWADALERSSGRRERDTPGAGAAGGIGFALLCLAGRFAWFGLEPGVELVMAATGFAAALRDSDLVLTGEGRIDAQTAHGKTALGVARRARDAGVACYAVGGSVDA